MGVILSEAITSNNISSGFHDCWSPVVPCPICVLARFFSPREFVNQLFVRPFDTLLVEMAVHILTLQATTKQ